MSDLVHIALLICMRQITPENTCLTNRGVNSNCNTVITAILFNWLSALNKVFHTDAFCYIYCYIFAIYTDLFTLIDLFITW